MARPLKRPGRFVRVFVRTQSWSAISSCDRSMLSHIEGVDESASLHRHALLPHHSKSNQVSTHHTIRIKLIHLGNDGYHFTGPQQRKRTQPLLTAFTLHRTQITNTDSHIISSTMTNKRPMTFEANENVLCFHGPLLYEAKVMQKQAWITFCTRVSCGSLTIIIALCYSFNRF